MWYQAGFIRGMTIDEALKQLDFSVKGFTAVMKEVLLEAQDLAVREQGVEFKSNLWIGNEHADNEIRKQKHLNKLTMFLFLIFS
jgi:Ribosomal protein L22p/L17e